MTARYSLPCRPWLVRALAMPVLLVAALAVACSGGGGEPAATASPGAAAVTASPAPTAAGTASLAAPPDATASPAPVGELTVAAADGTATLTIPAGALPPGVSASDIEITDVSDDPALAMDGGPLLAAFRLEPTGVTFGEPVTLRVTVALEDVPTDTVTFLFTEREEVPELLPTRLENRDEKAGTVTLATELSHFTDIIIYRLRRFSFTVVAPAQADVDVPFDVKITVRGNPDVQLLRRRLEPHAGTLHIQVATELPWFLDGRFVAFGPVEPTRLEDRPPRTSVTGTQFTVPQTFICTDPGTVQIVYVAHVEHQLWIISELDDFPDSGRRTLDDEWEWNGSKSVLVECVRPPKSEATEAPQTEPPPPDDEPTSSTRHRFSLLTREWVFLNLTVPLGAPVAPVVVDITSAGGDFEFLKLTCMGHMCDAFALDTMGGVFMGETNPFPPGSGLIGVFPLGDGTLTLDTPAGWTVDPLATPTIVDTCMGVVHNPTTPHFDPMGVQIVLPSVNVYGAQVSIDPRFESFFVGPLEPMIGFGPDGPYPVPPSPALVPVVDGTAFANYGKDAYGMYSVEFDLFFDLGGSGLLPPLDSASDSLMVGPGEPVCDTDAFATVP